MNVPTSRWLLVTAFTLVAVVGCSPAAAPSSPTSPPTPASKPRIDYVALETEIEKAITTGPVTLDKVRAVLVNVDGETKIAHYRHGFTDNNYGHVFSVTKSVVSILIGIAIADGLIADIDQPLGELLPKHRKAMSGDTAKVSLHHLMTMSGEFKQPVSWRVCLGGVRAAGPQLRQCAARATAGFRTRQSVLVLRCQRSPGDSGARGCSGTGRR
jgi:CubicO group peptidase (beta-lactamase class C family)